MHGCSLENIGLVLSGGIHDTYHPQIAMKLSHRKEITSYYVSVVFHNLARNAAYLQSLPNVDELFDILRTAIEQGHAIGANSSNLIVCQQHGVLNMHQYAVTGIYIVAQSKDQRIVKIHNPHNVPDVAKKLS